MNRDLQTTKAAETNPVLANYRFAVAPMIDWTDRHCRAFHRAISRHAVLYSEMIVDQAIVRGDPSRLLATGENLGPVVLQLGGSDAAMLAEAARIAADFDYQGINLNCGCPSDRVQSGTFGAIMMQNPDQVARALAALVRTAQVPVSLKCRLGVDEQDVEKTLPDFLRRVADSGIEGVTIHARKAWLKGLSPKENRSIPPLDYDLVRAMRAEFPALAIAINGGIETAAQAVGFLAEGFAGAMLGRAAYHDPYGILSPVDKMIFGDHENTPSRAEVALRMASYLDDHIAGGGRAHQVLRHMSGLYANQPGARRFRQLLTTTGQMAHTGGDALRQIVAAIESDFASL